jgi:uncharacterized protein (DUF488 family)
MLNRQRIILDILNQAGRPVSKLELMTWAFVFTRETLSKGGESFYQFLPYHSGPYSFSLQRDLERFAIQGIVQEDEKTWRRHSSESHVAISGLIQKDFTAVTDRFCSWSANQLNDYVDQTYPAYTVNSQREKRASRTIAPVAIYTSGYEGLQIDGFLDRLIQVGIQRLIDVRNHPIARRFGFHKSTLQRLCKSLEIDYVHYPELGILSSERQNLDHPGDYQELFERYERVTLKAQTESIEHISTLICDKPSVLVCMEAESCRCHRSRLATAISQRNTLPIVHLGE